MSVHSLWAHILHSKTWPEFSIFVCWICFLASSTFNKHLLFYFLKIQFLPISPVISVNIPFFFLFTFTAGDFAFFDNAFLWGDPETSVTPKDLWVVFFNIEKWNWNYFMRTNRFWSWGVGLKLSWRWMMAQR